jgi:hypothetical protein
MRGLESGQSRRLAGQLRGPHRGGGGGGEQPGEAGLAGAGGGTTPEQLLRGGPVEPA